jgi:hypothetical protein
MKLVYIAHPFNGDVWNVTKVEGIIKLLMIKYRDTAFYSPLHATGFFYHLLPYEEGMEHCYEALRRCDELWLCEGWDKSRGCNLEVVFAMANNIPIKYILKSGDVKVAEIKDSGTRREFETGAVRDMAEGKGDMYSLPAAAIIRLSKHYELGAKKYSRLNYQKGIPVSSFMDSALRHIFKYLDGCDDEDHLSAAAFNVLGAMQMEERSPDMQDVEARKTK